jgi:hypothetical protein
MATIAGTFMLGLFVFAADRTQYPQPPARGPVFRGTIAVEVENRSRVPQKLLSSAEIWTGSIFQGIGVGLEWIEPGAPARPALRLTLVLVPEDVEESFFRGSDRMGTSVGSAGAGPGRAYVSPGRVAKAIPRSANIPESFVLGCVIAHEIGHLLLPPGYHSRFGIMRPTFRVYDFDRAEYGGIRFTSDQATLIRRVVRPDDL